MNIRLKFLLCRRSIPIFDANSLTIDSFIIFFVPIKKLLENFIGVQFKLFKMKFCLIVVLVHVVHLTAASSENGTEVSELKQLPFQVSIRSASDENHKCSGAVLNNRFILTTAECVSGDKPESIYAHLGGIEKGAHRLNIKNIVEHESFNLTSKKNNIALLQTDEEINFSAYGVRPIQMPPASGSDSIDRAELEVCGWITGVVNMNTQFVHSNSIYNKFVFNIFFKSDFQCTNAHLIPCSELYPSEEYVCAKTTPLNDPILRNQGSGM